MRAVFLALALVSVPAAAAEQFDLICKGTYRQAVNGKWRPMEVRLRIDLPSSEWCRDKCSDVRKIAEITSGKITLAQSDRADSRLYSLQTVDRATGEFHFYLNGSGTFWEEQANCAPAPFSGFPARKF